MPGAALSGSCAGVPLEAGVSDIEAPTLEALVDAVLVALDDLPLLNRLHDAALRACGDRFEWRDRGVALHDALRQL